MHAFSWIRNCQTIFKVVSFYPPTSKYESFSCSVFSPSFDLVSLFNRRQSSECCIAYFIVILVCIFLMSNNVEYFIVLFDHSQIFTYKVFKSLAHFFNGLSYKYFLLVCSHLKTSLFIYFDKV